jgi:hypothetical protein
MSYQKKFFITLAVLVAAIITVLQLSLSSYFLPNVQTTFLFLAVLAATIITRLSNGLAERFARFIGELVFYPWGRKIIEWSMRQPLVPAPFVNNSAGMNELTYENFPYADVLVDLAHNHIEVQEICLKEEDFNSYIEKAQYDLYHPDYYKNSPKYRLHKQIQHYIATVLTPVQSSNEVWMDVASSTSPFPEIMTRLYGVKIFRQDLTYPTGVDGLFIGSNAKAIPLPDSSLQRISLHCSFEHFEGDADSQFIYELARLLSPGGMAAIIPIYLSNIYQLLTHPRYWLQRGVPYEPQAQLTISRTYWESHGRFYNADALRRRVLSPAEAVGLTHHLYKIVVPKNIDYPSFPVLLIKKPV